MSNIPLMSQQQSQGIAQQGAQAMAQGQPMQIPPDLWQAIELNKVAQAAQQQQALQAGTPPTVMQGLKQAAQQRSMQEAQAQAARLYGQQNGSMGMAQKLQQTQLAGSGTPAPTQPPPAQPQPQGIDMAQSNMAPTMAGGGIVAFADGGNTTDATNRRLDPNFYDHGAVDDPSFNQSNPQGALDKLLAIYHMIVPNSSSAGAGRGAISPPLVVPQPGTPLKNQVDDTPAAQFSAPNPQAMLQLVSNIGGIQDPNERAQAMQQLQAQYGDGLGSALSAAQAQGSYQSGPSDPQAGAGGGQGGSQGDGGGSSRSSSTTPVTRGPVTDAMAPGEQASRAALWAQIQANLSAGSPAALNDARTAGETHAKGILGVQPEVDAARARAAAEQDAYQTNVVDKRPADWLTNMRSIAFADPRQGGLMALARGYAGADATRQGYGTQDQTQLEANNKLYGTASDALLKGNQGILAGGESRVKDALAQNTAGLHYGSMMTDSAAQAQGRADTAHQNAAAAGDTKTLALMAAAEKSAEADARTAAVAQVATFTKDTTNLGKTPPDIGALTLALKPAFLASSPVYQDALRRYGIPAMAAPAPTAPVKDRTGYTATPVN